MKKLSYLLAVITLIAFVILRENYESELMQRLDKEMSDILFGNELITAFHYIGDTLFVVCIAVLLLLFLWIRKHNYRGMFFVLLTFGGGTLLNQVLKNWVQRPRPEIVDQLTSFSFPSGHTMSAILYLLTVAYIISEIIGSGRKVLVAWLIAILLAFMIGISRIAEGRHFATDVLAGWAMGYTWFIACTIWYERSKKRNAEVKQMRVEK